MGGEAGAASPQKPGPVLSPSGSLRSHSTPTVPSLKGLAQMGETDSGGPTVFICLVLQSHPLRAASLSSNDSSHTPSSPAHLLKWPSFPTLYPPCSFSPAGLSTENALPGSLIGTESPFPPTPTTVSLLQAQRGRHRCWKFVEGMQ